MRQKEGKRQQHQRAVTLFIQRAQAIQPTFELSQENADSVAEICRRLDGLPLALELAAAWIKLLSPAALLARLERRLPLLVGRARDLPERQQTMERTIAWSEDLLTPEHRHPFHRMSVFVGGATLEAIEAVCSAPAGSAPLASDVLETLNALVTQSLVQPCTDGGECGVRVEFSSLQPG